MCTNLKFTLYTVPVRLIDESGTTRSVFTDAAPDISRGRVELLLNGEWHTVCSHGFGFKEANVVCNQLGLNGARRVKTGFYGEGSNGIVVFGRTGCGGGEVNVLDCSYTLAVVTECSHHEDVGVECLGMGL